MTEEALQLVRLKGYGQRRVTTLSGGEQQRVSLARALVMRPQMLLLDEPLSALDLKLRQQMQAELHALQKELKITFIFVTHDQDEALTLSDRIAVMSKGDVLQLGTPQEIYHHPQSSFVAQFIGNTNSLPVQCTGHENGLSSFATPGGRVLWARRGGQMDNGDKGVLFIRPEHISLQKSRNGAALHGSIKDILFKGAYIHYVVGLNGEGEHIFHIHVPEHKKVNASIGERISLAWISEDAILFPNIQ
jgi:spermidine/putrescine transport system ATP-binding protein